MTTHKWMWKSSRRPLRSRADGTWDAWGALALLCPATLCCNVAYDVASRLAFEGRGILAQKECIVPTYGTLFNDSIEGFKELSEERWQQQIRLIESQGGRVIVLPYLHQCFMAFSLIHVTANPLNVMAVTPGAIQRWHDTSSDGVTAWLGDRVARPQRGRSAARRSPLLHPAHEQRIQRSLASLTRNAPRPPGRSSRCSL